MNNLKSLLKNHSVGCAGWWMVRMTCSRRALRELPSPGKSGSVFFLSDDDRFMVKTVSHEEMGLLLRLLPGYTAHCGANPATLLTRFYGVHRIKHLGRAGSKARQQQHTPPSPVPSLPLCICPEY